MKRARGRKNLPISIVDPAPGELRIVQDFVNTADFRKKTESLSSPRALADWLASRGLLAPEAALSAADLSQAVELREGIRALLFANNGAALPDADVARLGRAAATARFQAAFAPDGAGRFVPLALTFDDALGRLIAIVISAQLSGAWTRLKACAHGKCRGVFYDASRNRSAKWCSMRRCDTSTAGSETLSMMARGQPIRSKRRARESVSRALPHSRDELLLRRAPYVASIRGRNGSEKEIRELEQLDFMGADGLDPLDDATGEVVEATCQDLVQLFHFRGALSVLDVEVDPVARVRRQDDFQEVEIHLEVPVVIALPKISVAKVGLVGDQGAEVQVVVVEEVIEDVAVVSELSG